MIVKIWQTANIAQRVANFFNCMELREFTPSPSSSSLTKSQKIDMLPAMVWELSPWGSIMDSGAKTVARFKALGPVRIVPEDRMNIPEAAGRES